MKNRGGKAFRITHLDHALDGLGEKIGHKFLGTQPINWDSIVIPWALGVELYERWSQRLEKNRKIKGKKKLSKWLRRVFKKYSIVIVGWDITTLILILLLRLDVIEISLKLSLYSVLPLVLYIFIIPTVIGVFAIGVYWSYREMKEQIEKIEKKGPPELENRE